MKKTLKRLAVTSVLAGAITGSGMQFAPLATAQPDLVAAVNIQTRNGGTAQTQLRSVDLVANRIQLPPPQNDLDLIIYRMRLCSEYDSPLFEMCVRHQIDPVYKR